MLMNKRDKKERKTNFYNKQHHEAVIQQMIDDKNKRLAQFDKKHRDKLEALNREFGNEK